MMMMMMRGRAPREQHRRFNSGSPAVVSPPLPPLSAPLSAWHVSCFDLSLFFSVSLISLLLLPWFFSWFLFFAYNSVVSFFHAPGAQCILQVGRTHPYWSCRADHRASFQLQVPISPPPPKMVVHAIQRDQYIIGVKNQAGSSGFLGPSATGGGVSRAAASASLSSRSWETYLQGASQIKTSEEDLGGKTNQPCCSSTYLWLLQSVPSSSTSRSQHYTYSLFLYPPYQSLTDVQSSQTLYILTVETKGLFQVHCGRFEQLLCPCYKM